MDPFSSTSTRRRDWYSRDDYRDRGHHHRRRRSASPSESRKRRRSRSRSPSPSHHHQRARSPSANSATSAATESEGERRERWTRRWAREGHHQPPRPLFPPPAHRRRALQIEYWDRTEESKRRKEAHVELLDALRGTSREDWILSTTLKGEHVALEPNLFPYETPPGVSHYTLWSRTYLTDAEVESFVERWLDRHRPHCTAWAYDPSNLSEGMSIDLYHVHVFTYTEPALSPRVAFLPQGAGHRVYPPVSVVPDGA